MLVSAVLLVVQVDLRCILITGDPLAHHASFAILNSRHVQGLGRYNRESSAGIGLPKIYKQSFDRLSIVTIV